MQLNIEAIHPNHTSDDWVFLLKSYKYMKTFILNSLFGYIIHKS